MGCANSSAIGTYKDVNHDSTHDAVASSETSDQRNEKRNFCGGQDFYGIGPQQQHQHHTKPQISANCPGVGTSHSRAPASAPAHEFLTVAERSLVLSQWEQIGERLTETGIQVYLLIFQLAPDVKDTFVYCNLDGEELVQNTLFRCHARRFMRTVAMTIANLDDLDVIVSPNLIELGRKHRKVKGFRTEHLEVFEKAMIEIWSRQLGDGFTETSACAWQKLFRTITERVREGYGDGDGDEVGGREGEERITAREMKDKLENNYSEIHSEISSQIP